VRPGSGGVRVDAENGGGDMSESTWVDVLDPDYRSYENVMARRATFFVSMRHLDELSRQLSRQADDAYQARQASEPVDLREWREEREIRLRDLVLRAIQSDDVDDWRQVDELAFGPGAE
jgi:hypothetical protein